jgi:hypothetical protein
LKEIISEFIQIPELNHNVLLIIWLDEYGRSFSNKAVKGFKSEVVIQKIVSNGHFKKTFYLFTTK